MKQIALLTTLVFSLLAPLASHAETSTLVIKSFTDYTDSDQSLDEAKEFSVDLTFVNTYNLQFYIFANGEDEVCFTGSAKEANDIVQAILETQTGDAYVYPERSILTKNSIKQDVRYEYEGGERRFSINLARCH